MIILYAKQHKVEPALGINLNRQNLLIALNREKKIDKTIGTHNASTQLIITKYEKLIKSTQLLFNPIQTQPKDIL